MIPPKGYKPPVLIGIAGFSGVGKTEVSDFLNGAVLSFADPLKEGCSALFGIPESHFHNATLKEKTDPFWGVSPRQILQFVGTELFRKAINGLIPDIGARFWVKSAEIRLSQWEDDYSVVIFPDIRFQEEYNFIAEHGGIVIHLSRSGYKSKVGIPNHESEKQTFVTQPGVSHYVINNGTLSDLFSRVTEVIKSSKIASAYASAYPNSSV